MRGSIVIASTTMPENPFEPPESDVNDRPPQRTPYGSPVRAIAVGLVIDLGGSVTLSLVLMIVYAASLQHDGLTPDQLKYAMEHIPPDSWAAVLGTLLGACLDVLSGFVCARIVGRDEWRVGGTLAGISALCTLMLSDGGESMEDVTMLLTACTAACTLLGVKYGREMNQRLEIAAE
jgi:hypothetical protein